MASFADTTRIFDPNKGAADVIHNAGQGDEVAAFDSNGLALVTDISLLQKHLGIREVGFPGLHYVTAAGTATTTVTVPSGKFWRLISIVGTITTDASVGNRTVNVSITDATPTEIESYTMANVAASQNGVPYHYLIGGELGELTVGNVGVAAAGTLTITDVPVGTITLNGIVFTFAASLTGAVNEIISSTEVACKAALLNAFGAGADRESNADHSVSDAVAESVKMTMAAFSGDTAVFTNDEPGLTLGTAIGFAESSTNLTMDGSATMGGTTEGVNPSLGDSALNFPEDPGAWLGPAYTIVIDEPGLTDAGDVIEIFIAYIEYDADPNLAAGIGYNS